MTKKHFLSSMICSLFLLTLTSPLNAGLINIALILTGDACLTAGAASFIYDQIPVEDKMKLANNAFNNNASAVVAQIAKDRQSFRKIESTVVPIGLACSLAGRGLMILGSGGPVGLVLNIAKATGTIISNPLLFAGCYALRLAIIHNQQSDSVMQDIRNQGSFYWNTGWVAVENYFKK